MTWVAVHRFPNPNKPLTKTCESETSHGRNGVIDRKYLLNGLLILHVHANEVQYTTVMERFLNDRDFLRAARAHILCFQERHFPGSLDIFLQS